MGWPLVKLGEILDQDLDFVTDLEPGTYKKLSVKLYGKGVVPDKPVEAHAVRMKKHQIAKEGQIIVSEIWAKKGAIGIVPPNGNGALCTSHFYLFNRKPERVMEGWLRYLLIANFLEPQLSAEARGTTGYASVRPRHFLYCEVPLPPLAEQQRIVAKLDKVAALVEEAKSLRREIDREMRSLVQSVHFKLSDVSERPFGEFIDLWEDRVSIEPTERYPQVGVRGFGGGLFFKDAIQGSETKYKTFNRLSEGWLVVSQPKGWEGAVAVCDASHEGWHVSPEYRTFRCKPELLNARYLAALLLTPWFQRELTKLTRGQGARRERLRPEMLLDMKIRMPAVEGQEVALRSFGKLRDLRAARGRVEEEMNALLPVLLHGVFRELI